MPSRGGPTTGPDTRRRAPPPQDRLPVTPRPPAATFSHRAAPTLPTDGTSRESPPRNPNEPYVHQQPGDAPAARVAGRDTTLCPNTSGGPNANPGANGEEFWRQNAAATADRNNPFARTGGQWEDGVKPWGPLMLTLVALFASIGANMYMGMVVARTYWRYLDLASELGESDRREARAEREAD